MLPPASAADIEDYYEAEKATQFTTPASRDVRLDRQQRQSRKSKRRRKRWKATSRPKTGSQSRPNTLSDPTTKATGGLQKGITEEFVKGDP